MVATCFATQHIGMILVLWGKKDFFQFLLSKKTFQFIFFYKHFMQLNYIPSQESPFKNEYIK